MTSATNSAVTAEVGAWMGRRGRMSAKALARELGWSYGYLNRRLNEVTPWSTDDLEAVAAVLDVPVVALFGERGGR